jgi:signal transduction histidine kinase
MFNKARLKLTLYYLAIIMTISGFFSLFIYKSTTFELTRIQMRQGLRRPNQTDLLIDTDIIDETKGRIIVSLLTLNGLILLGSGVGGYFLAGKTLEPISKMINEQKDFISNASHELRTPLTSLKTEIEVGLRNKNINLAEAKDLLKSNLDDVNEMNKLSDYLLKLNKFQDDKTNLKLVTIDLSEIVRKSIGKKKIKTNLEKTNINGDEDSLIELVTILVDNAIKYGNKKDVSVIVKRPGVLLVKDKGIGISKEDIPHIFDRFYRGNKSREKDGYGLGLSIANQIIKNHNAKIRVESELGKGSTFKVIFS